MKKVVGIYNKKSARFGLHEWHRELTVEFENLIQTIIRDSIEAAALEENYECYAWFPCESSHDDGIGGEIPKDPTTIYVGLPLAADDPNESVVWTFTLTKLVDSLIEMQEQGEGGPIDEDHVPAFVAVRDSLRALADKLDAALNRKDD